MAAEPADGVDLETLREAVAADRKAGCLPFLVAAHAGSVKTGAILWSGSSASDGNDLAGDATACSQAIQHSLQKNLARLSVAAH